MELHVVHQYVDLPAQQFKVFQCGCFLVLVCFKCFSDPIKVDVLYAARFIMGVENSILGKAFRRGAEAGRDLKQTVGVNVVADKEMDAELVAVRVHRMQIIEQDKGRDRDNKNH